MRTGLILVGVLLVTVAAVAFQCSVPATPEVAAPAASAGAKIMVTDAWTRPSSMGAGNGAIYLKLMNDGNVSDVLLSAKSDIAEAVELHESKMDENGVMHMNPVPNIEVPAGGSVSLEPGGKHIMLINLKQELAPGQKVAFTLNFEKSGPVKVEAEVRADSGLDSGNQNMQGMDHK